MKAFGSIVVFFFSIFSCLAQSPGQISVFVVNAYLETKGAYDKFDKMQNVVKDIENGKIPNVTAYGSDWNPLVSSYIKAANQLKEAPLPTEFDSKSYSISIDEINNCHLKDENFKKLRGFKIELDEAIERGNSYLDTLAKFRTYVEKTDEAVQYLIAVNGKLSSVPIYNEIFQWNWFDLETAVRPSLSALGNAVKEQDKKLRQEIEKIKNQSSNLNYNIDALENSICLISGNYKNTCANDDLKIDLQLDIVKSGGVYSAVLTMSSGGLVQKMNSTNVSLANGKFLNVIVDIGRGKTRLWTGELSKDYKIIYRFKQNDTFVCDLIKK